MSGSEDFKTVFYAGPPFKREGEAQVHSNYVNCVRFSPDGEAIVSVGSDKKLCVFEGKTGKHVKTVENLHDGSIYTATWFPEGGKVLTTSADKTAKVVSIPSGEVLETYTLGSSISSFVVGGCVAGTTPTPYVITLSGDLHLLTSPTTSVSTHGHQGSIKSMCYDPQTSTIYTSGSDGRVLSWSKHSGTGPYVATPSTSGTLSQPSLSLHSGSATQVVLSGSGHVVSCGWDDVARVVGKGDMREEGCVALGGQPKAAGADGGGVVVATKDKLVCLGGGRIEGTTEIGYMATAIAVKGEMVVVGDDKNNIHVYNKEGGELKETNVVTGHTGVINSLSFNSSGTSLAAGDVKEVRIWNTSDWSPLVKGKWQFHTSRITSLSWSPCGSYVASVGTDENLFVWCVGKKMRRLNFKFANKGGCNGVEWTGEGTIVTAGEDGCLAEWNVGEEVKEKFK
ncbi:hypothetical protein TrRE_jg11615 [Triparma retinervis]|uniref:Uncharacterized protein n=1 Tax=Triparma retinervis TaxID=2557542 RepID=A0A9W7F6P9_9STRA|nr:hypothetical protein TrRE_jg11615 [Triparma retinervis]